MVKYVRKANVKSFPELFGQLTGDDCGKITAIMVFLKTLPITYAIGMGIFLSTILPISFPLGMGLGLACIFSYSLLGGFRAIVFSDFLQVLCMYAGVIAVVVASFSTFGGFDYLLAHCPATHFSIHSTFSILDTLVWLFIACSTTFLNPTFYQRSLAATTDRVAIWGIFIATGCWFVFDICTTLIGLYARAAMPEASPIHAALTYSLAVLPTGWKGLFLGAILATLLSTLDSFLFIASTTLTYDLKLTPDKPTTRTHLLASFVTILLTFCIALCFQGNFELAWRMLKSIFTSCTFPILIIGYWKPRIITKEIFTGVFISVLLAVPLWTIYKPWPLDAFYIGQAVGWIATGIGLGIRKRAIKKLYEQ